MKRSANHHAERCRELADILIVPLREVARRHGYALAVHGSLSYDIDLIACPWRDLATTPESLVEAIHKAVDAIVGPSKPEGPTQKPYGRQAWVIHMGGGPYIDLSVMPISIGLEEMNPATLREDVLVLVTESSVTHDKIIKKGTTIYVEKGEQ